MTRVFLADTRQLERSALRLVLQDLNMEVVGETADWVTALTAVSATAPDMLIVDWDLIPGDLGVQALAQLHMAFPKSIVVVLANHLDARRNAALLTGADALIIKGDMPERVALLLRLAAAKVRLT